MRQRPDLSLWRYELTPVGGSALARAGCLLRFGFLDGVFGYADCHPWPELGDASLSTQIDTLKQGGTTELLDQSACVAFVDAKARRQGVSLFHGLTIPPSHLSLPHAARADIATLSAQLEEARAAGFDRVKVKSDLVGGSAWLTEVLRVCSRLGMKLRIDLNTKPNAAGVTRLLNELSGLDALDWIEDPCPFDDKVWNGLRSRFAVRLAYDRAATQMPVSIEEAADVLVCKPALEARRLCAGAAELGMPVCYTSYLDHPIGQCFAAFAAASNMRGAALVESCGLLTHTVYEPNAFSERIACEGPRMLPPAGTGLGFDDLLEGLPWERIEC